MQETEQWSWHNKSVFVAGHRGMVGSAICEALEHQGCECILTKSRSELDLTDQGMVADFFNAHDIQAVFLAAAKVGGIHANDIYPADFIYDNLLIQNNIIGAAHASGVERLLFLGSSCIYPKMCSQPIRESYLLSGALEPTNEPYAIAKIAGIKLCESFNRQYETDFRSIMPTNLYGPNDNFHPENSHVIPALIGRFHAAKINNSANVSIWGTGTPKREFLHVTDLAHACLFILGMDRERFWDRISPRMSHINVGTGEDVSIGDLAHLISKVVGYQGDIVFDTTKPDGTPRKLLDVSLLASLGWRRDIALQEGLANTYSWFENNINTVRQ